MAAGVGSVISQVGAVPDRPTYDPVTESAIGVARDLAQVGEQHSDARRVEESNEDLEPVPELDWAEYRDIDEESPDIDDDDSDGSDGALS